MKGRGGIGADYVARGVVRRHSGATSRLPHASLVVLVLAALASFPSQASAQGVCLILLGCTPDRPVITPPPGPPPAEACAPQTRRAGSFIGMVTEDVFWDASGYRGCVLNDQVSSGVSLIRQTFDWSQIERSRGSYDFSWYDRLMVALAERRLRVLPILFNAPRFRSSGPSGRRRGAHVPRRYGDMGRFAARVVRRYGSRGSFWRAHPDLPRVPIRSWQIWNEPNVRVYWPSGPNPREYTRLLLVVAKEIRKVDRRAEIVTAGIPDSTHGMRLAPFVQGMYRAKAGRSFDTLAVNGYSSTAAGVPALLNRARRIMNRNGDRRGRLWLTEFGWSSGGPASRFRVSREEQARRLSWTLRSLYASRGRLRLRGAVYYNWRDGKPYPPLFQDFFGLHTGLIDADRRPKPAYWALRRLAPRLR